MITKLQLEQFKQMNIGDVRTEDLTDISKIDIDKAKPVAERIRAFIEQIGNPYLFKVGDIPVKVSFAPDAPTLQKTLETLFTKNY